MCLGLVICSIINYLFCISSSLIKMEEHKVTETIRTGGFQIDVSLDMVQVSFDKTAYDDQTSRATRKIFSIVLVTLFGLYVAMRFSFSHVEQSPYSFLFLMVIFGASALFQSSIGKNNIRCTRESLQVVRVVRGRTAGSWTFPIELISAITYSVFSSSRYGNTCGLAFSVQSNKVKTLAGLKIVEAKKILDELDRLGFSVVRDVAMPMMVEMEQERRKSIFS